ncbi:hypothetical protein CUMW_195510 [Citrus unshiu]|uniref:RING-type E3 ubiquitin transferase n=1 Tax=Citrus unshiu TaxID=55188 RepID=A0A2H5Q4T2_CITUN|nr:hypothetical protein CUMW_195510 [Citrus unshiu]
MSTTSSFSSTQLFQDFPRKLHSRKLLPTHNPLNQPPARAPPHPSLFSSESNLDKNVLIVLSVLVCTVICTIVLNFVIKCALSSLRLLLSSDSSTNSSATKAINKGINKKALKAFPVVKYSAELKLPGLDAECVICLSDFALGEHVRLLPKCNHGFHVHCIDRWLRSNSSCPKCRHCLIETCEKIVGCSQQQASSLASSTAPVQETVVISIVPLEPEGVIQNYVGQSPISTC